ncbi:hypothetical protein [Pseudonocardia sp. HH130630-07]|nr:hypothetical protein [Pseudonocardia sp. HH130630-07]
MHAERPTRPRRRSTDPGPIDDGSGRNLAVALFVISGIFAVVVVLAAIS